MQPNDTSTSMSTEQAKLRFILYINYLIFGGSTIVTNLITLLVILSDKHLRAKYALIVGLAIGNFLNGLHAFGYGTYRMPLLLNGMLDQSSTIWSCMATTMPLCIVLGYSMPATLQFVIGLERLVAISAFNWYRQHWTPRKTWYTVCVVYTVCITCWIPPLFYQAAMDPDRKVTKECSSATVIGPIGPYLILFSVLSGTAGVLCLFIAVLIGRHRVSSVHPSSAPYGTTQFTSQFRFCKMMLVVAICDMFLVVGPNILMLLGGVYSSLVVSVYGALIYCLNSTSNIFIYLIMNKKFRCVAFSKFRALCTCKLAPGF